jgi:hypothetical protein
MFFREAENQMGNRWQSASLLEFGVASTYQVFAQSGIPPILSYVGFQAGYFFGRYIIMGWMGDTKPKNINKHFGGGITVHSSTVFVVESVFMCH